MSDELHKKLRGLRDMSESPPSAMERLYGFARSGAAKQIDLDEAFAIVLLHIDVYTDRELAELIGWARAEQEFRAA